jgi:hypothetical protein
VEVKISELEDYDKLVTKEYLDQVLDTKLAQLELRLTDKMMTSERGQRMWVWGLYALVIISYFVRH